MGIIIIMSIIVNFIVVSISNVSIICSIIIYASHDMFMIYKQWQHVCT